MWKESDKKLVVRLQPSPALSALLLLMHGGAWVGIFIVPMSTYAMALLAILVGLSLRRSLMPHGLRNGCRAAVELELQDDDIAVRFDGSTVWVAGNISDAFVHPWLVTLRLRLDERRWPVSVVIPRGAIDSDVFRAMRVRLKGRVAR